MTDNPPALVSGSADADALVRRLRDLPYRFRDAEPIALAAADLIERLTNDCVQLEQVNRALDERSAQYERLYHAAERRAAEMKERCAKVAEATRVRANGHPQIDAPTPGDMQRAIAAAIRQLPDQESRA